MGCPQAWRVKTCLDLVVSSPSYTGALTCSPPRCASKLNHTSEIRYGKQSFVHWGAEVFPSPVRQQAEPHQRESDISQTCKSACSTNTSNHPPAFPNPPVPCEPPSRTSASA